VAVLFTVFPSEPDPRVVPPPPRTSTTSRTPATPITTEAWIKRLGLHGVDYSQPKSVLVSYLNNPEFTSYPALADALLQLLAGRVLRRPVDIFSVVWNYENDPGNPSPAPRRVEDVDFDVLKDAVLENFNERYGQEVTDFESLLKPAG
jgi:hypothetical protein